MKLLHFLGLIFLTRCTLSFDHVITYPKALRLGAEETIVLDLLGYENGATVSVFLQDLPHRENVIEVVNNMQLDQVAAEQPVMLTASVQPHNIRNFASVQRVALIVEVAVNQGGGAFNKELEILVTPESGYIFVITDQPVYMPGEQVLIKAFTLNQTMERDTTFVRIVVKTPDGIGTTNLIRQLPAGDDFVEESFRISTNPVFGRWSVEVSYALNGYDTVSEAHFLVEEFVLPTFQVSVELDQNFVYVEDSDIGGKITASYSYGEHVEGSVYLSMKVTIDKGDRIITREFFRVPNEDVFTAFINDGLYRFAPGVEDDLMPVLEEEGVTLLDLAAQGSVIFAEATVTERGSGHIESAVTPNIPIVSVLYVIDLTRTSFFYIPSLSYTFRANILFTVGRNPASGVTFDVRVNNEEIIRDTTNDEGDVSSQLDFPNDGQPHDVEVRIFSAGAVVMQRTITIIPYTSLNVANPRYLQISTAVEKVWTIGERFPITFGYNYPANEIRFFVVARGTIVVAGVNYPRPGSQQSSQVFVVDSKMAPNARIVAYYIAENNEVVSDSYWFDVQDQFKNNLVLRFEDDEIQPGETVIVNVEGAPNSLVSVTAVDRAAYFIYNESRLTPSGVFEKMASYDQGCRREGGRDGYHVFLEAGLQISTSTRNPETIYNLNCPGEATSRKKRQAEATVDTMSSNYIEDRFRTCSESARLLSFLPEDVDDCAERANRCRSVPENLLVPGCCDIFEQVCVNETRERFLNIITGNIGRTGADAAAAEASIRRFRQNFEEGMLFRNVRLDNQGMGMIQTRAHDSITNYEFDAASMERSGKDGFSVAETKHLRVFRNIFVQVYAPYAMKRREQTSLRVAIFNYGDEDTQVFLEVRPPDKTDLCTHFPANEWSQLMTLTPIRSHSSISTSITILPLRVGIDGETSISFRVKLRNDRIVDLITRTLRVEEVGEITDTTDSEPIDLMDVDEQVFQLRFDFPEAFVSGSRQCWLYAYPNLMGPAIEVNPLNDEPRNVDSFFRMPRGCGEQTMIFAGPNVYAHMYLDAVEILVPNTPPYEASLQRNRDGYNNEIKYRSTIDPRAWSVFNTFAPSTWLNAFVDKVFTKANEYDDTLDLSPICQSLEWLLDQQTPEGEFVEGSRVIHREMHGGVGGSLTLTSYVAIALLETQSRCPGDLPERVSAAVTNAVNFLIVREDDDTLQAPYGLALYAYVLALHQPASEVSANAQQRLLDISITENDRIHWEGRSINDIAGTDIHAYWYQRRPLAIHIEATAYALLALITRERQVNRPPTQRILDITRKTVLWLIGKRNGDGGAFTTTQDTIIALQALATYQMWTASVVPPPETDINIGFSADGTEWENVPMQFQGLTNAEARIKREIEVPADVIDHQSVVVTARGNGEGMVSYRCIYRTQVEEETCHFNINEDVEQIEGEEDEPITIKLTISVSAINSPTGMSIIEVGYMSGFVPVEQTVLRLSQSEAVDGVIQRYEITDISIIFYVSEIDTEEPLRLAFDMRQTAFVNQPQPARIYVYDYYEPSIHCGVFYALPGERPNILTSNCGPNNADNEFCTCAEGGCVECRARDHQLNRTLCIDDDRACHLCEPGEECTNWRDRVCQSNYIYQARVTSVSKPQGASEFHSFKADINVVHKEGDVEGLAKDSSATFLIRSDCLEKCDDANLRAPDRNKDEFSNIIHVDRELMIFGTISEEFLDRNDKRNFQFRLDGDAIVERIFPEKRCQNFEQRYERFNCRNLPATAPARRQERCAELRKETAACENQRDLFRIIDEGCG